MHAPNFAHFVEVDAPKDTETSLMSPRSNKVEGEFVGDHNGGIYTYYLGISMVAQNGFQL